MKFALSFSIAFLLICIGSANPIADQRTGLSNPVPMEDHGGSVPAAPHKQSFEEHTKEFILRGKKLFERKIERQFERQRESVPVPPPQSPETPADMEEFMDMFPMKPVKPKNIRTRRDADDAIKEGGEELLKKFDEQKDEVKTNFEKFKGN